MLLFGTTPADASGADPEARHLQSEVEDGTSVEVPKDGGCCAAWKSILSSAACMRLATVSAAELRGMRRSSEHGSNQWPDGDSSS